MKELFQKINCLTLLKMEVAMTLIRIGDDSIEYLERAARTNKDFEWVAKYLITEISGKAA